METATSIMIRVCFASLLIVQTFMSTSALKKTTNFDDFTNKNQKIHQRENFILKRGTDDGIVGNDEDFSISYSTDYLDMDSNPEELPSMIVDYANMIRNDIILLDNSVESRTQKRGNLMDKKHNQATLELPCSCVQISRRKPMIDLGEGYFPRHIETKNCSKRLCPPSYTCQKSLYNITILKKSIYENEVSHMELPDELKHSWIGIRLPITIGCTCTRSLVDNK